MPSKPTPKKLYVGGALTHGNGRERKIYEQIAKLAEKLGLSAYVPHLSGTDPIDNPEITPEVVWQNDYREVSGADIMVAYMGQPTTGTGSELEIARQNNTLIIIWWFTGEKVSRMAKGNPAVKAQLEVKDEAELYQRLEQELNELI